MPERELATGTADALARLDQQQNQILNAVGEGICGVDHRGHCTFVNPAAARLLGYDDDALIGRTLHTLVHQAKADGSPYPAEDCPILATLRDGAVHRVAGEVFWRADGTCFPVEYVSAPLRSRAAIVGAVVAFRDVTERQRTEEERTRLLAREQAAHARAEEALRRERAARAEAERLAAERTAILGKIADAVLIADPAGRVVFANDAARQLFDLLGRPIPAEVASDDGPGGLPIFSPLRQAALRGETVAGRELTLRRSSGKEIAVEASATPVRTDDGSRLGAVLTVRDVTAHRALERQKAEFLANVSHDLRTPLTAIKASIGVVLANEPPGIPAPLHRLLVNIDLSADRMAALVANLLELTRIQAGRATLRPTVCDLRELARDAARAIEPLAQERGQRLELDVPAQPVRASVDAERLGRALLDLLGNAQKYGREAGTIRLRLEARPDEIRFGVADDGPGIGEDDREHLFERFYRGEAGARSSQGSGLGLPIARAMVELHGGRIWAESTLGVGTTFWIAIPITRYAPPHDSQ